MIAQCERDCCCTDHPCECDEYDDGDMEDLYDDFDPDPDMNPDAGPTPNDPNGITPEEY